MKNDGRFYKTFKCAYLQLFTKHIFLSRVKLSTDVVSDPKAPFSIATTLRCREGRYSIPRIALLYL